MDIEHWLTALEARHLGSLTFSEVARAARALSATYVQRRSRLASGAAIDTAGKRAAYALYFGPLHFITVTRIVTALDLQREPVRHVLDLGCGAGAAGVAWAVSLAKPPEVTAVDAQPWAVDETAWTATWWGLNARAVRRDVLRYSPPSSTDALVAGWMLNELDDERRAHVQAMIGRAHRAGARVLVIEPIATRVTPWWSEWAEAIRAAGGRADQWRFRADLPDLLSRFDHATGLAHDELTARTLYLPAVRSR